MRLTRHCLPLVLLVGCAKSAPTTEADATGAGAPAPAPAPLSASLLFPGSYASDALRVEHGEEVLALCGEAIERVTVTLTPTGGDQVDVDVSCDATALFLDLDLLTPGPVIPAVRTGVLSLDEQVQFALGKDKAVLRAMTLQTGGYAVVLDDEDQTWTLVEHPGARGGVPSLLWAGDLDGDKGLDLILDAPANAGGHGVHLLLSSPATEGPMAVVATLWVGAG